MDIVPENKTIEKEPEARTTKNKKTLEIMQRILLSIYNIEQFMENLTLDDGLEMECNILIARAKSEMDKKNSNELEKIEKELHELNKKLETTAGSVLGSVKESEPESKHGDDKSKKSETDTRPFKILKK